MALTKGPSDASIPHLVDVEGVEAGDTQISLLLRQARAGIPKIATLPELNAVREMMGASLSGADVRRSVAERREFDLMLVAIRDKLAEFGETCADGALLLGRPQKGETLIALRLRTARLSLVGAPPEDVAEFRQMFNGMEFGDLNIIEQKELDLLMAALDGLGQKQEG